MPYYGPVFHTWACWACPYATRHERAVSADNPCPRCGWHPDLPDARERIDRYLAERTAAYFAARRPKPEAARAWADRNATDAPGGYRYPDAPVTGRGGCRNQSRRCWKRRRRRSGGWSDLQRLFPRGGRAGQVPPVPDATLPAVR